MRILVGKVLFLVFFSLWCLKFKPAVAESPGPIKGSKREEAGEKKRAKKPENRPSTAPVKGPATAPVKGGERVSTPTAEKADKKGSSDEGGVSEEGDDSDDSYPNAEWNVYSGLRFNVLKNGLNFGSSPPAFEETQFGPSLLLGFEITGNISKNFSIYTAMDIGELSATWSSVAGGETFFGVYLNGYDFTASAEDLEALKEEVEYCKQLAEKQGVSPLECEDPPFLLQESLFIRELYAQFSFGPEDALSLEVGMFNRVLGNALIADSYVMGLRFKYDRSESERFPFTVTFDAFLPDSSFTYEGKKSPTLQLKFDFQPVKGLHLGIFTTYLYDGNNLSAKLLLPLWQELYAQYINSSIQRKLQSLGIDGQTNFSCDQVDAPRESTFDPRSPKTITAQDLKDFQGDLDNQSFDQQDIETLTKAYSAANQKVMVPLFLASFIDLCNTIPSSSGNHLWFGLDWSWSWREKIKIEGTAILYFSKFTVGKPTGALLFRRKSPKTRFRPGGYASHGQQSTGMTYRYGKPTKNTGGKKGGRGGRRRSPLTADTQPLPQTTSDLTVDSSIPKVGLTGLGFAGELQFTYYWPHNIETAIFFVTASGDRFQNKKTTIYSFMGISPQVRYTDLFFSGGINAYSSKRGIGISGIAGTGYLSPGITASISGEYPDEEERFELSLTAAAFWSYYPPPYQSKDKKPGKFYGGELNFIGNYNFRVGKKAGKWIVLSPTFQLDFFFPGNFFAPTSPPAVVIQFLAGLDFSW